MKISAAIVTFNRLNYLRDSIDAIMKQTVELHRIVIVDNASNDGTKEYLEELSSNEEKIIYKRLEENTGGAGGFHEAVKIAYEIGSDKIWLMDDDVEPEKDCLEKLLHIHENYEYAIVQPNRSDGKGGPLFPMPTNWDESDIKINEVGGFTVFDTKESSPMPIVTVPFEGPLIDRTVVEKIGLPQRDYFIFYDDTDFSMRATKAGFKIALCPNALLVRKASNNNPLKNPVIFSWRDYFHYRNLIYFYNKFNFKKRNIKILMAFLRINKMFINNFRNFSLKQYVLFLKAFKDGFLKRRGKTINF